MRQTEPTLVARSVNLLAILDFGPRRLAVEVVIFILLDAFTAFGQVTDKLPLYEAIRDGKAATIFTGTGASSGDSVKVSVAKTPKAGDATLKLVLPPGSRLHSMNPASQDMIVMSVVGRAVSESSFSPTSSIVTSSSRPVTYILSAFCAEFEKGNPSPSDTFTLQAVPDPVLACIARNGRQLSVAAEQAAVWMYTDRVTYSRMSEKFSVSRIEWSTAATVLARCQTKSASQDTSQCELQSDCLELQRNGETNSETRWLGEAKAYYNKGQYADAESRYREAIAVEENAPKERSLDLASALDGLASVYYAQGRYVDAEPLLTRSLTIRENLAPNNVETASSLRSLANLYYAVGKYEEAEQRYRQALRIDSAASNPDRAVLASELNSLAGLEKRKGNYSEALELYHSALQIDLEVLGPEHPAVATDASNLAELYQAMGRNNEAEMQYTRALALREKHLGFEHPAVAATLSSLASLYQDEGKYDRAEPLYKRALAIDEKVMGPDHPGVASDLRKLAALYDDKDEYAKAQILLERALSIDEKVLGSDHPYVATDLNNLALIYEKQHRYKAAETLYRQALAISEKTLGPSDEAIIAGNLAHTLRKLGRNAEAQSYEDQVATLRVNPSTPPAKRQQDTRGRLTIENKTGEAIMIQVTGTSTNMYRVPVGSLSIELLAGTYSVTVSPSTVCSNPTHDKGRTIIIIPGESAVLTYSCEDTSNKQKLEKQSQ